MRIDNGDIQIDVKVAEEAASYGFRPYVLQTWNEDGDYRNTICFADVPPTLGDVIDFKDCRYVVSQVGHALHAPNPDMPDLIVSVRTVICDILPETDGEDEAEGDD